MNSKFSLIIVLITHVGVLNSVFAQGSGVERGGGLACREQDRVRLCELTQQLPSCSEWSNFNQLLSKIPKPVSEKFSSLLQAVDKRQPGVFSQFQGTREYFKFCILNGDSNSPRKFLDKNSFLKEGRDIILDWQVILNSRPDDVALFLLKTLIPTLPDIGDLEVADD